VLLRTLTYRLDDLFEPTLQHKKRE